MRTESPLPLLSGRGSSRQLGRTVPGALEPWKLSLEQSKFLILFFFVTVLSEWRYTCSRLFCSFWGTLEFLLLLRWRIGLALIDFQLFLLITVGQSVVGGQNACNAEVTGSLRDALFAHLGRTENWEPTGRVAEFILPTIGARFDNKWIWISRIVALDDYRKWKRGLPVLLCFALLSAARSSAT